MRCPSTIPANPRYYGHQAISPTKIQSVFLRQVRLDPPKHPLFVRQFYRIAKVTDAKCCLQQNIIEIVLQSFETLLRIRFTVAVTRCNALIQTLKQGMPGQRSR
jgi:hypothetical protein